MRDADDELHLVFAQYGALIHLVHLDSSPTALVPPTTVGDIRRPVVSRLPGSDRMIRGWIEDIAIAPASTHIFTELSDDNGETWGERCRVWGTTGTLNQFAADLAWDGTGGAVLGACWNIDEVVSCATWEAGTCDVDPVEMGPGQDPSVDVNFGTAHVL